MSKEKKRGVPMMPRPKWNADGSPCFRHLAITSPTQETDGEAFIDKQVVIDYLRGRYGPALGQIKFDAMTKGQLLDLYQRLVKGEDVSQAADAVHVQSRSGVPTMPRMKWRNGKPDYSHL